MGIRDLLRAADCKLQGKLERRGRCEAERRRWAGREGNRLLKDLEGMEAGVQGKVEEGRAWPFC